MAGSSTAEAVQPKFYFDLCSPDAWIAGERALEVLGVVPEWVPVRYVERAWRCAEEEASWREDIERRAAAAGLLAVRWPPVVPPDTDFAMLAATYAKQIGRAVAFSLAAFRQAYAAGRDLGDRDTVFLAGAAAEIHPTAVVKGTSLGSMARRLEEATAEAGELDAPAFRVGDTLHHSLESAATALRG